LSDLRYLFVFGFGLLQLACTGTGQPEVALAALVNNAPQADFLVGDVNVTLSAAEIAFGPAYFCASASGSAGLCETALGEIRDVTAVDLLTPGAIPLGTYKGFSGAVRSVSFDYGIHWFLPEQEPQTAPEAPLGHSAHFAGTAERNGKTVSFSALVDVTPLYQGERAVTTAKASGEISETTEKLIVSFDVPALLSDVDFSAMLDANEDPVSIASGSRDHDSIVIQMVSASPPSFLWQNP
jgi:hypothetical protein